MSRRPQWPPGQEPYIENYKPLHEWLKKHEARCEWQIPIGKGSRQGFVECWSVGNALCLITVQPGGQGWDFFTNCPENNIDKTFIDAERRCGLRAEDE